MCNEDENFKIAIVSRSDLLRNGFITLLSSFSYCSQSGYSTGKEFILDLDDKDLPHLIFIDIDKNKKEAYETITYLKSNYPFINLLALTIEVDENSFNEIKKSGANGFVLKTATPQELEIGINSVSTGGFYYNENITHAYDAFILKKLEAFIKKHFR